MSQIYLLLAFYSFRNQRIQIFYKNKFNKRFLTYIETLLIYQNYIFRLVARSNAAKDKDIVMLLTHSSIYGHYESQSLSHSISITGTFGIMTG